MTVHETSNVSEGSTIHPTSTIHEFSVVKDSTICPGAIVGSHTLIRGSHIGPNCMVGSHAEVARSVFRRGSGMHSGYVGDTIIGEDSRLGAGTVVSNVEFSDPPDSRGSGANIGSRVRTGVNVSIMPGVSIGDGAIIGPHTLVVRDIPENDRVYCIQEYNQDD